jgi:hypothetical protein
MNPPVHRGPLNIRLLGLEDAEQKVDIELIRLI